MASNDSTPNLRSQLRSHPTSSALTRGLVLVRRMALTTLRSMGRNILLTFTVIIVMTAMLGSVLLLRVAGTLGDHARTLIAQRITISLEVRELANQTDVDRLMTELKRMEHVTSIRYISKEEAASELASIGVTVPDFLTENPLAARLRIVMDNLEARASVLTFLETSQYKDTVIITEREKLGSSYEQRVASIDRIIGGTQRVGIALAILFALIGALVIVMTVRLTIHSRRDELSIMQLVGASPMSIIGPFVLEGVLDGLIGAVLALSLFTPLANIVFPGLAQFFEGFSVDDAIRGQLWMHLAALAVLGGGIGLLSSLTSTIWYLRKQPVL